MSEFREDLLVAKINKKRVVGIILVTILLIASFAFSILLSSLIFDSQRPFPSDELSEAEEEQGIELITAPFPFNFSDFLDLNLTRDLLESLLEMFDGNIDDLDLGDYSEALAALLFSEIEVFRVYDYEDFNSMNNKLWKYECFDEYYGEGWHSTSDTTSYPFSNYDSNHWDKDLIRIKMPINPTAGVNSMVLPHLFSRPFIVEGSITAPNLDLDSLDLYKNDFNCTTIDMNFFEGGNMNMSYELFGQNLPTNLEINNSALHAIYTPLSIKNQFLQLPTTVQAYLAENPHVYGDYLNLNDSISPNDNSFMVANKIRNYLQYQFSLPLDLSSYTSAPEGRDVVDYFCETREGVWSEFATAFCVFSRIFGVASRFVDGFNSFGIEQIWDPQEMQNTTAIKYQNIYNWAEIYVPTNTNGDGDWVQMDIYNDQFGPIGDFNYRLTVNSNFTAGFRNDQDAFITATLSQQGSPVQGKPITFIDLTTDQIIGTVDTNVTGKASVIIPINNSQVVGPHSILAYYNPQTANETQYTIYGDIKVNLTNVNPSEIDLSVTDLTYVEGFVEDPLNNARVQGANLEFVLLDWGTNNKVGSPPFSGITINNVETDLNGYFGLNLDIDPSVPEGQYEIRVDFNGTFYGLPLAVGIMNASSNRMDFNITRTLVKKIWFYINDIPSSIVSSPTIPRESNLRLKAYVLNNQTKEVLVGEAVDFYDYTDGSYLGTNSTNFSGFTTLDYFVGSQALCGPNLLYAKLGIEENYSYYVLDEIPTIHIISGPTPREINRTGSVGTSFNIIGEITNAFDRFKKIGHSEITVKLFRGAIDYSSYLIPYDSYPFETGANGYFNLNFGVASNIPLDNYSLRIDFYGIFNLISYPYSYLFNLTGLSNSTYLQFDLKVTSPPIFKFDFWIDDYDNHNYYQPIINRDGFVNLSIYLVDGTPLDGEDIKFYDITQGILIGTVQTSNGRASLIYNTNSSTVAGPHLIRAEWGSNYNYSYFTLNDNIVLDVLIGPVPNQINRGGETFNLQGTITDASNGSPIKYAEIYIAFIDDTMTDVSYYLSSNWFYLDETGTFDLTLSVDSGTPTSNYTINVVFDGGFIYSFPNNQYNQFNFYFDTITFSNFTSNDNANYELRVIDPDDVAIQFEIDGNPALSFYDDFNLPERYNKGDSITFSVYVTQNDPVEFGTVILTDVYTNTTIDSYIFGFGDNGRHDFIIDSSSWHAGLHKIRVQWESYPTTNSTYVIINDTISIAAYSSLQAIQRNVNSFNIFGSVQDNSVGLRGLNIKILFLDSSLSDVSGYLNLAGSQYINLIDGTFQFDVNSISINCPQGAYYFRIDFNGSINDAGISLTDYMIHSSSFLVSVNIKAGIYIVGNYDTSFEGGFYEGDTLNAYGYLYWDNGSLVTGSMTITITIEDGMGGIITTEVGFTDGTGWFNISILIDSPDWPDETEVYASFEPEDSFIVPDYYIIELFRP